MVNFRYYVVEFLESPRPSVPRFVCIPYSWMKTKITAQKTTAVGFPDEHFVATQGRILSGESADASWPVHIVNVKSGFDDLNEGLRDATQLSSANTNQEKCQTNQNIQLSTPSKPAKRAAKRSMSVDAHSLNKGSKRPNIQLPDEDGTPTKANPINEKRQNKAKEIKLLERLLQVFGDMAEEFDNVTYTLGNISEIVDNIKTSLNKTANMTNDFLNNQKLYDFPDDTDSNSKWTLRHRVAKAGLTELLPGSKVYVRIAELENLKTEATNASTAARMLMMEIFSDYALSKCSLQGGKRWSTNELNSTNERNNTNESNLPGLDERSLIVLMKYLKKLALERDWELDERQIWNSLRNKLLKLRNRCNTN